MKTSKLYSLIALIGLSLLLMGCPYSSEVPLSSTPSKPSENLYGTWEESGNPSNTVTIAKSENNMLDIQKLTANEGEDPTVESYKGFLTDINGTLFLNVKEMSENEETGNYYIYKIGKEGEFKMLLFEVTDNIRERFTSSEEMKKFFADNMNHSYFYTSGEITYFKIK